jgi:antibiotic biosynthesis monooxygenase (ABM) superfamily enzyme
VSRRVKPGHGPFYDQFLTGINAAASRFPGHLGVTFFPLITVVVVVLEPLLEEFALVPRLAVTTAVTVPIMTWLAMPRITRLLRGWLYPEA